MRHFLAGALMLLALGGAASAQEDGYVNSNVNLRAGPSTGYPVVTVLQAGTPLEIFGCLDEYTWCDVDWRGYRGWIAAQYLEYDYRGRRVLVPDYAPQIGVPIVAFSFGDYWGRYYRGRSWYSTNDRWGGPPVRRPPPQAGWNGGPPPGGPGWGGGGGGWNGGGRPPQGGNWNGGGRPPQQGGWNNGGGNNWNGGGRPPQGGPPPQQGGQRPPQQRPPQQGGQQQGQRPPQQRPPQQAQPQQRSQQRGASQNMPDRGGPPRDPATGCMKWDTNCN